AGRQGAGMSVAVLDRPLQAAAQPGGFTMDLAAAGDDLVYVQGDGGKTAVEILAHPLEGAWKRCVDLLIDIAAGEPAQAAVECIRDGTQFQQLVFEPVPVPHVGLLMIPYAHVLAR